MKRVTSCAALVTLFAACSDTVTEPPGVQSPPRLNTNGNGTTVCEVPGQLRPGVYENVVVPPNSECIIEGLTITGHLTALPTSRLISLHNTVGRGIEAVGASRVHIEGGQVDGNIRIVDGLGTPGDFWSYRIENVTIREGHVRVMRNTGGILIFDNIIERSYLHVKDNTIPENFFLNVVFNSVGRHIEVFRNRGQGVKAVSANNAAEYVNCHSNTTFVLVAPNDAPSTMGQCANPF